MEKIIENEKEINLDIKEIQLTKKIPFLGTSPS